MSSSNSNNIKPTDSHHAGLDVKQEMAPSLSSSLTSSSSGVPLAYKQYTEGSLREAIDAVVEEGVRLVDASSMYGIPITTLGRRIRSCEANRRLSRHQER